uniref:Voltage-gated hydrogen channel 1 n=1 Tax=Sinocyclocheilus rhinocerous TaxID=307959 RepID=A0A673FQ19_9TELE
MSKTPPHRGTTRNRTMPVKTWSLPQDSTWDRSASGTPYAASTVQRGSRLLLFAWSSWMPFSFCASCLLTCLSFKQIITESLRRMFLPLFQVFHYLSLTLLTFFMVELSGKIYAYRLEFLHHKFEVFDGIVVVVSFILDIVYISKEDAFDAMGLLILLRLWRVARIINGIIMSVKNRAHHKVQKIKEINENLVHQVNELKERNTKMDQENARLRAILKQHCIEF